MTGIRRELGAVYKEAREGRLNLANACKFAYLLSTLCKVSEADLLEQRLGRLEERYRDEP